MNPICPYCGAESKAVTGRTIYPHRRDLHRRKFYQCAPCDAYVGTHRNSGKPLGRLADARLRKMKRMAHAAFDPLWKEGRFKSRTVAYAWLSERMGLPKEETHIGMFDIDQCKRVIEVCDLGTAENASTPQKTR